jgi:hypothetical protein
MFLYWFCQQLDQLNNEYKYIRIKQFKLQASLNKHDNIIRVKSVPQTGIQIFFQTHSLQFDIQHWPLYLFIIDTKL